jgi:hypothetical protein
VGLQGSTNGLRASTVLGTFWLKLTGRCPYDNESLLFKDQAVVQPQMPHLAFAGGGPWTQTPDALGQLLKPRALIARGYSGGNKPLQCAERAAKTLVQPQRPPGGDLREQNPWYNLVVASYRDLTASRAGLAYR